MEACPICGSEPQYDKRYENWKCLMGAATHMLFGPGEDDSGEGWNAMVRSMRERIKESV